MQRLLREPLLYFLLAGAGIFAGGALLGNNDDDYTIVVTAAQRVRLNDQWQAQMGRAATSVELSGLIEQWIREEIYYREALRMGLDRDDTIIRRRLAQKLTFLTEDVATSTPPSLESLQQFFAENADRYAIAEQFSFRHRYFSTDRRVNARADAVAALADATINGDPFMLQASYAQRSQRQIADLFGNEFAAALPDLPVSGWHGPIRSAYGWHVVRIEKRQPARTPTFSEVSDKVGVDHKHELRRIANERYFDAMRGHYQIIDS